MRTAWERSLHDPGLRHKDDPIARFHLERSVFDVKCREGPYRSGVSIARVSGGHHQMSGERRFSRAHGPDMEVMNLSHTGALSQIGLNSKRLNPRRHGIKRKVYRISKELPRPTTTTATMIKLYRVKP